MLDVHPPHTPTHTWRDFLIHIATIVIGLLIAIGLEQTVEYLHHRHQVTEARDALRAERQENYKLFALETRSFNLATPYLQKNVEILLYLRSHPRAPPQSWPGAIVWPSGEVPFVSAAWSTVQRDGVIELLPQLEVEGLDELYKRLDRVRFEELAERDLAQQAGGSYALQPDLSNLEARDLDKLIDLSTQLLITTRKSAASRTCSPHASTISQALRASRPSARSSQRGISIPRATPPTSRSTASSTPSPETRAPPRRRISASSDQRGLPEKCRPKLMLRASSISGLSTKEEGIGASPVN